MKYDVLIIGSGITGCSIAFELSKYDLKVGVIEKENDVSMMTTKANSGIIHAGYDPKPGTKMARLNVLGNKLVHELYPLLNFSFSPCGSLVIGKTKEEHEMIDKLYQRGIENGVPDLYVLKTKEEVHEIEPYLNDEIDYALYSKSAGIVSPWELCLALAYNAKVNGVDFFFNSKVTGIEKKDDTFTVKTTKEEYTSKYVINAAGLYADDIYNLVLKDKKDSFKITPCKGEYFLLDKEQGYLSKQVIFQCPSKLGKGVLVTKTVHGNLLVGPNASYDCTKDDTSTTSDALNFIKSTAKNSVDKINFMTNIRNFTGVRAGIDGYDDFLIEESKEVKGFINFAGIKSPGLSSAVAFGKEAIDILSNAGLKINKKDKFEYYKLETHFRDLSLEEKENKIKENNLYGQVICRCETVTEAEILNAMHAPIPGTTIDAIKRRCNAGMGRCQGGFCSPKIAKLLMNELHLSFDEIYQDKTGSSILVSKTKESK